MSKSPFEGLSHSEMQTLYDEGMLPMIRALHQAEQKAAATPGPVTIGDVLGGIVGLAMLAGLVFGAFQLLIG